MALAWLVRTSGCCTDTDARNYRGPETTPATAPDAAFSRAVQLHAPVAPTGEVLEALKGIGRPVGHIVLPNGSPEHWYFGPAMAAAFPDATVWVAPGQPIPDRKPRVALACFQPGARYAQCR